MAACQQGVFLLPEHVQQLGIPHGCDLPHVAGGIVAGARQKMQLLAFGVAVLLGIVGLHLALGGGQNLVYALLGDNRRRRLGDFPLLQRHLGVGPDGKGSPHAGTQLPGGLAGALQHGNAQLLSFGFVGAVLSQGWLPKKANPKNGIREQNKQACVGLG